jgi:hypothetical protein
VKIDNKKVVLDNLAELFVVGAFHQTAEEHHMMAVERSRLQFKLVLYQINRLFYFQWEVELMVFIQLSCPHTSSVMP